MATSTFNSFNIGNQTILNGNMGATGSQLEVTLISDAITTALATKTTVSALTELTANGAGSADTQNRVISTGVAPGVGVTKKVWSATGTGINGITAVVLDDATQNSLIGYWPDTTARNIASGNSYTITYGATLFTLSSA